MGKITVDSQEFDDTVMNILAARAPMSLTQLNGWTQQLSLDKNYLLDATINDTHITFEARAGSDVGAVARALYNFAILFQRGTSAKFNGMELIIVYKKD